MAAITRRQFFTYGMGGVVGAYLGSRARFMGPGEAEAAVAFAQGVPLGGNKIAQFVDPLPALHTIVAGPGQIALSMQEDLSPVMPTGFVPANGAPYAGTYVWRYVDQSGQTATSYIGPVVVATRDAPTEMRFTNNLGSGAGTRVAAWSNSTDQTLHWADPMGAHSVPGMPMPMTNYEGPVPAVVHLHGGEVPPQLDGGPDAWFTSDGSRHGAGYYSKAGAALNEAVYRYPNSQEHANIWFHDHALGITRLNVYAGMAGAYLLVDPTAWKPAAAKPELIPLVIQDRMFDTNGQLYFPNLGINPEHPFWIPEFVGDTIVVNGKVWPYKAVDQKRYTLWFLNGSNARAYDMFLIDPVTGVMGPSLYVISTDGGHLDNPALIDPNTKKANPRSLTVMPGERYEAVVDFNDAAWKSAIAAAYAARGVPVPSVLKLHLRNNARTPFPGGAPAQNSTTGRVMEFRVNWGVAPGDASYDPAAPAAGPITLRTKPIVRLVDPVAGARAAGVTPAVTRQLTLNEVMGPGGPLEVLVNNTKWNGRSSDTDMFPGGARPDFTLRGTDYLSELPSEGTIEQWEIINLTADAHPIHLHLVQFQLMNRQAFDVAGYQAAYDAAFPGSGVVVDTMTGIVGIPKGMFIPAFGPPLPYGAPNGDGAVGGNPAVSTFLAKTKKGAAILRPPLAHEAGWKDTVIMYPGDVTRIMVRWAPTDAPLGGTPSFPFDPSGAGVYGYVWHCHIIDHEDNEMMRPDAVTAKAGAVRTYVQGVDY